MGERSWTIDRVEFDDAEPYAPDPRAVTAMVYGRTSDGRAFYSEVKVARDVWEHEDRKVLIELVSALAKPPPEDSDG